MPRKMRAISVRGTIPKSHVIDDEESTIFTYHGFKSLAIVPFETKSDSN